MPASQGVSHSSYTGSKASFDKQTHDMHIHTLVKRPADTTQGEIFFYKALDTTRDRDRTGGKKERHGHEFIKKGSTDKYLILSLDRAELLLFISQTSFKRSFPLDTLTPFVSAIAVIIWNAVIIIQPKNSAVATHTDTHIRDP